VYFPGEGAPGLLENPVAVVTAHSVAEVLPALRAIEQYVEQGYTAAGYMAYEAAPAFDPALSTHPTNDMPLLWFGIYTPSAPSAEPCEAPLPSGVPSPLAWQPQISAEAHASAVEHIRALIGAGDTYQVNLTFPCNAAWQGDALEHFSALCAAQSTPYAACINPGRWQVLSASPELFFELDGDTLTTRPMKGTRPRGRYPEEDAAIARALGESGKDLAENVMITDLLRNDLGRVAEVGSVRVPGLFSVERYPTVWQLTSTIEARTRASVPEIFGALFPCGSVTGAPKVRTMAIIRAIEAGPRGVYCGAIGWWAPGRRARFSVAIRTVVADVANGTAIYHTGSGITWDSQAGQEYAECLDKTAILSWRRPPFELLETLRFDGEFALLERHLSRMAASAEYFGLPFDAARARAALDEAVAGLDGAWRVRLLSSEEGDFRAVAAPLAVIETPLRVGVAAQPVDSGDVFLFHKTTQRGVYERALKEHPKCDEVLLFNERGEITEGCWGNVVVTLEGRNYTPPVFCGLLAGCARGVLLEQGEIEERVILREDLARASRVRMVNSVRGWMEAQLV
jgi:para-aminobenzoate synthetase/4-amino-4-deoxychorismate lyase